MATASRARISRTSATRRRGVPENYGADAGGRPDGAVAASAYRRRHALLPLISQGDRSAIWRALHRLDLERMAIDVETLTVALARDLIEPADFAVRP
jgi:hypothetical protein